MRNGDNQATNDTPPYISSIPRWAMLKTLNEVMVEFKDLYIEKAQQTYSNTPTVNANRMQAKSAALACMELIREQFDTDPNDRLQCIVLGGAHHAKCHPTTYKITTPQNRMNGLIIFKSGKPLLALGIGECPGPRIQTDNKPHAGPDTAWCDTPFFLTGAERKPNDDTRSGSLIGLFDKSGAPMNCRFTVVADDSGSCRETLAITFIDPKEYEIISQLPWGQRPDKNGPAVFQTQHRHNYVGRAYQFARMRRSPCTGLPTQWKERRLLRGPGFNGAEMSARIACLRQDFTKQKFKLKYKNFLAAMQSKMKPNKALDKAIRETSVLRAATLSLKQHHDVAPTPSKASSATTRGPQATQADTTPVDNPVVEERKGPCTIM